jgi:phosphatidate cytidylyltransferase
VVRRGALLLGLACLHELFELFADVRPARLAGFLALIGLVVAAMEGDFNHDRPRARLPVPGPLPADRRGPVGRGRDLRHGDRVLGVIWIGLGIVHACCCASCPTAAASSPPVLAGTFVGDTGRLLRRPGVRQPADGPAHLAEQDGRGPGLRDPHRGPDGVDRQPLPGLDRHREALVLGAGVALAAPLGDLFESFIKRDAGTKDTGRLFGAHGGALDRLDAVLWSLVVGYWIWRALL